MASWCRLCAHVVPPSRASTRAASGRVVSPRQSAFDKSLGFLVLSGRDTLTTSLLLPPQKSKPSTPGSPARGAVAKAVTCASSMSTWSTYCLSPSMLTISRKTAILALLLDEGTEFP